MTLPLRDGRRRLEILSEVGTAGGLVAGFLLVNALCARVNPGSNPDQWFHFAISRLSQSGMVRSLPQAEDLGWGKTFPEKEFLFHLLTGLAWRIGGIPAVEIACKALSSATIVLLYRSARAFASRGLAATSVFALVIANPFIAFRLGMVRPHVLAIFCAVLLVWALLARNRIGAAIAGLLFALAYHAVYLPAALAAGFAGISLWRRRLGEGDDRALIPALLALGGIAAGIFVNPYFPLNVTAGAAHLGFAFAAGAPPGVHPGGEVMPLQPLFYLQLFGIPLGVALVTAALLRMDVAAGERPWDRALLTAAGLFLVGASIRSARASEYGIPFVAIALAMGLGAPRRSPRTRLVLAFLACASAAWPLFREITRKPSVGHAALVADLFAAIDAIPPTPASPKVFNCDWNYGSFLLYERPDARFVDLLDPRFLEVNPPLFEAKRLLDLDALPDPVGVIRDAFHARYVLCANPALDAHLAADARVTLLRDGKVKLFAIAD